MNCDRLHCNWFITTTSTDYRCSSETITFQNVQPALTYRNTPCSVSVNGVFSIYAGATQCFLHAFQTVTVNFSSGVNSAFNGAFAVSATFKPTQVHEIEQRLFVNEARITLHGVSLIDSLGSGSVSGTTFTVTFPGDGIELCSPSTPTTSRRGVVSAVVAQGAVTITR
jgi:hypothetical protein